MIEQIGADMKYAFNDDSSKTPVGEQEQMNAIKNFKSIMEEGNENLFMHSVEFKASERTIKKILGKISQSQQE